MKTLYAALVVFAAAGCGTRTAPQTSDVKFDAAHSVALDVTIDAGRIVAVTTHAASIEAAVREQLYYTIGQLNGLNGGSPDMRRTQITLDAPVAREDGLYDVKYSAKLFVSWPRERAVPADYTFVLPARGDWTGLYTFFEQYGSDEDDGKKCLAWEAHDVSQSLLWYYYRPLKSSCALRDASLDDPSVVARVPAKLVLSAENTEGKSPEYGKVWQDGKLVVTAIFGKNEAGATHNGDAGIAAYRQLYRDLIAAYGEPATTNLEPGSQPDVTRDDVRLTFAVPAGTLDVHIYLVDGIRSVDAAFQEKYNERTEASDFVSYSGHSGLGANIRALARMGRFVAGQYQIFLINGCDTFSYVDGALRDAHHAANPGFGPDKYFDIITNAMPSYFHMNSRSNMAVIDALAGQAKTYREILAGFDRSQRANVTGEEDNVWPEAFGD